MYLHISKGGIFTYRDVHWLHLNITCDNILQKRIYTDSLFDVAILQCTTGTSRFTLALPAVSKFPLLGILNTDKIVFFCILIIYYFNIVFVIIVSYKHVLLVFLCFYKLCLLRHTIIKNRLVYQSFKKC